MKINDEMIEVLYKLALKSYKNDEIPVGAIVMDSLGNIVSKCCNTRQNKFNVLGHAEINAILRAERKIKDWRLDEYYMLVSLKPCDMCSMIIKKSRIKKVYYLLDSDNETEDFGINSEQLEVSDDMYYKFKKLLTIFFSNKR